MTSDVIFLPTDLAGRRRIEFLAAARQGLARLRDKDGTSLVMLPEGRLRLLEALRTWTIFCLRLDQLVAARKRPTIEELGELAWLRAFDMSDLEGFTAELHEAIAVANSDEDISPIMQAVHAWKETARQLQDPLSRSTLLGKWEISDFVEAERPE